MTVSLPVGQHRAPHLQEDAGEDHHGHACTKVLMRDTNQGCGDACMTETTLATHEGLP